MPRRTSAGRRGGTAKSAGGGQGEPSGGGVAGVESVGAAAGTVVSARDGPQHAFIVTLRW
ncbi:hypothetical protein [Streptomyces sp. NPDC048295]|uniref:hypothetical protein n=1 Tax=Streptomyces sp. NPDC048295 TaxID=3154617 RepID=UPI00342201F6